MFSIIIPVYNAIAYISRGLAWVQNINVNNIEIIIIDDGSNDGSALLLDEYAANYDFINVFHTENRGASEARQFGMEKASGEWLMFWDIDDYIDLNIEHFIHSGISKEIDLHVFSYNVAYNDTIELFEKADKFYSTIGDYIVNEVLTGKWGNGFLFNKIYKTNIAKRVQFTPYLKVMEDEAFNLDYLTLCNTIMCHNEAFYTYYLDNPGNSRSKAKLNFIESGEFIFNKFNELKKICPPSSPSSQNIFDEQLLERTNRLFYHAVYDILTNQKADISTTERAHWFNFLSNSRIANTKSGGGRQNATNYASKIDILNY